MAKVWKAAMREKRRHQKISMVPSPLIPHHLHQNVFLKE